MKNILVYKEGKTIGPFTWDEIRELLKEGELNETDYIWLYGDLEWTLLSETSEKFKPPVAIASRLNKKEEERLKNDPRTKTTVLLLKSKKASALHRPLY